MLEFISTHIMELGWTCIVGILAMIYKSIQKNFKKVLADNQNMKFGVQAVLHDRLIQKCTYIIQREYVTTDDLDELEELNKPYKALGGNGTVKTALEKVKQLPLK
nr:MAG TPA: holin protein [Bacteriophage sp.]